MFKNPFSRPKPLASQATPTPSPAPAPKAKAFLPFSPKNFEYFYSESDHTCLARLYLPSGNREQQFSGVANKAEATRLAHSWLNKQLGVE